jgi:hypothetical protein
MKQCTVCLEEKDENSFFFKNTAKNIRHSICKQCYNASRSSDHYQKNKQAYIDRAKETQKRIRNYIISAKAVPCADCGKEYHFSAMDFDHVTGEKKFNLSQVNKVTSIKAAKEEIAKCEVVCSNCHRFRTWNRRFQQFSLYARVDIGAACKADVFECNSQ